MARLKRPVMQTYLASDVVKGKDPYAGMPYSQIRPEGAPRPTHRPRAVPGVRNYVWEPQLERWTR